MCAPTYYSNDDDYYNDITIYRPYHDPNDMPELVDSYDMPELEIDDDMPALEERDYDMPELESDYLPELVDSYFVERGEDSEMYADY